MSDTNGGGGGGGTSAAPECTTNAECKTAYTCEAGVCRPPETQTNRTLSNRPPVATPHYVYALNQSSDTVARIDPRTLAIEAIPVGPLPVDLTALPGEDAAVCLSYGDGSVALIDSSVTPSKVVRLPLKRQHARLVLSGDGAFAVAFSDPNVAPVGGAEGIVTVIDVRALRQGKPDAQVRFERSAGYRVTNVIFRMQGGVATQAFVIAKSSLSIIELLDASLHPLPARVALPDSMAADIASREVVADATGKNLIFRSTVSPELAWFDGTRMTVVPLPEVATDLDLLPDGTRAVAALRVSKKIAFIRVPEDLLAPAGIVTFDSGGAAVGQVVLPPSGAFAFVYTNASADKSFARVDLPGGAVTRYLLEKWVDEIDLSPDGASAVVIHRPDPASTASDPYERAVDADQGYSVFDVATGYSQLKRTGRAEPGPFAFSPVGAYLGVAVRDETLARYTLDAVNLNSLVASTIALASKPLFMGSVPLAQGLSPNRVFVSQVHPAGRISVVDLAEGQIRTATGFTLNAEIQ
ncbi:MAG: YncE family protein [Myxococcaceae bacterium]